MLRGVFEKIENRWPRKWPPSFLAHWGRYVIRQTLTDSKNFVGKGYQNPHKWYRHHQAQLKGGGLKVHYYETRILDMATSLRDVHDLRLGTSLQCGIF